LPCSRSPRSLDDELPLYVTTNGAGFATGIFDAPPIDGSRPLVTGGVYGLSPVARRLAGVAVSSLHRMRAFLKLLVDLRAPVATVEVRASSISITSGSRRRGKLARRTDRPMKRLVALYRSPTYSPHAHRQNDTAILDATVDGLERRGWDVVRTGERDVAAAGCLPPRLRQHVSGPGRLGASAHLVPKEALAVNPPESVLNCHRHRLVEKDGRRRRRVSRTLIVPTADPQTVMPLVHQLNGDGRPVWVEAR